MAEKADKHRAAVTVWIVLAALFFCLPSVFAGERPAADAGSTVLAAGAEQPQPAVPAVDSTEPPVPSATPAGEAEFDEFGEFEEAAPVVAADPLGGYNRFMTGVNDRIYVWAFRPVARGYRFVVVKPVRLAIARVFTNVSYPVRCVNNLLQLKIRRAGVETGRFIVNTTLGVGGLFDPATNCMKMPAFPEDFGQTLGHYGVGSGFHIVLPLMGPSNVRDALAILPDMFLQPVNYIDNGCTAIALNGENRLNTLSLFMDDYDALRAEAFDLYVFQRDAYEMKRKKEIGE